MSQRSSNFLQLLKRFVALILLPVSVATQFNFEVERRVVERLQGFFTIPIVANEVVLKFRENGGFLHDLTAPDRDAYFRLAYSLPATLVYFALEDGTFAGYNYARSVYREPGNSGYVLPSTNEDLNGSSPVLDTTPAEFRKHVKSCVTFDGKPQECALNPGQQYINLTCQTDSTTAGDSDIDCKEVYIPCPDAQSQECAASQRASFENTSSTPSCAIKYCREYIIETVEDDDTRLAFVPMTVLCIDDEGQPTQRPGQALNFDRSGTFGDCLFPDGATVVSRNLTGDFAYCGGGMCNNTFVGGVFSTEFDPRYRSWYRETKRLQTPNWSPTYLFASNEIGLTYSQPFYSTSNLNENVFEGVVGVDYELGEIAQFLVENYKASDIVVAVYEDVHPFNLIGSSTGSPAAPLFVAPELTTPCENNFTIRGDSSGCAPIRIPVANLSQSENHLDRVIAESFKQHSQAGYPRELLPAQDPMSEKGSLYVSQVSSFGLGDANLRWRIIVASPGSQSSSDAVEVGSPLFAAVCTLAGLGFAICFIFFVYFYTRKTERAIIIADWRFTCAFMFGCALLNISMLSLLGGNTAPLCQLRAWLPNFFFVVALAPLFVKIWRMHRLVGHPGIRRACITNIQAAIYVLPIVAAQAAILTLFAIFDPSIPQESIEIIAGAAIRSVECRRASNAFFYVQLILQAGLVAVGCFLAYQTRNMKEEFSECRQLIFAMYNVALVGTVIIVVTNVTDMTTAASRFLYSVGVFWGTSVSTGVFALPRILQVKKSNSDSTRVHVSGMSSRTDESHTIG